MLGAPVQLLQTLRLATSRALENVQLVRSISSAFGGPLLYRDFIQQSLYHPELGYFNKPQPPIRRLPEPINFNRILNQAEYKLVLSRIYKQLQVDWLTPVEVFAPWYGRAIAHYILEVRKHTLKGAAQQPLSIVEIGGGTGTLAASILDHIAEKEPITYSAMSYSTIELSSSLAAAQQDFVVQQRGHSTAWRCIHGDAATPQAWTDVAAAAAAGQPRRQQQQHCFVLMMEVLDNLPHDRVARASADADWQQLAVTTQQQQLSLQQQREHHHSQLPLHHHQQRYEEVLQPAGDPLIQRCLQVLYPGAKDPSSSSGSGSSSMVSWFQNVLGLPDENRDPLDVWLPTRCLQLLETIHQVLPSHTLIAADFDALPDIKLPGKNAPLVSGRSADKKTIDYDTVLVPWGSADIFFPTDFNGLGKLYTAAAGAAQVQDVVAADEAVGHSQQQQEQQHKAQPAGSSRHSSRDLRCDYSSTADFMAAFAEARKTCLLSGYNPLVQDWPNTRVFLGHSTPN